MKKSLLLALTICSMAVFAQDEGTIVKRERIQRDKSIFLGGGISIAGGSNLGDYSTGINFEGGFVKRVNRVLSIGGSISYLKFEYDANFLKQPGKDLENFYFGQAQDNTGTYILGVSASLTGGNVSLISLAGNIKLNLIPIKENTVVSVYGFAKPFVTSASTAAVTGNFQTYRTYDLTATTGWTQDAPETESFDSKSKISGGILIGSGIEFFPNKSVSFFLQASFGYTLPIGVVSTKSYSRDLNTLVSQGSFDQWPYKDTGFTSINFAGGISFNLD